MSSYYFAVCGNISIEQPSKLLEQFCHPLSNEKRDRCAVTVVVYEKKSTNEIIRGLASIDQVQNSRLQSFNKVIAFSKFCFQNEQLIQFDLLY